MLNRKIRYFRQIVPQVFFWARASILKWNKLSCQCGWCGAGTCSPLEHWHHCKATPQHAAGSGKQQQAADRWKVPLLGKATVTVAPRAPGVPTQPDLLTLQSHTTETFFRQVVYFTLTWTQLSSSGGLTWVWRETGNNNKEPITWLLCTWKLEEGQVRKTATTTVQPNKPPPPNNQELFLTSPVMEHLLSGETEILLPLRLGPEGRRRFSKTSPRVTPAPVWVHGRPSRLNPWRSSGPTPGLEPPTEVASLLFWLNRQLQQLCGRHGCPQLDSHAHTRPSPAGTIRVNALCEKCGQRLWQQSIPQNAVYWLHVTVHEKKTYTWNWNGGLLGELWPKRCSKQPPVPFIIVVVVTFSSHTAALFVSVRRQWKDGFTLAVMPGH